MKALLALFTLAVMLSFDLPAQTTRSAAASVAPELTKNGPFVMTSQGGHYRVWERLVEEPGPLGKTVLRKRSFVECAVGLDYRRDGQWVASEEIVEPILGGAVAQKGPHRVLFLNDLATAGAIDMETPDGKRLLSSFICVSYFDTATGSNVLLGEVKSCLGKVSGNKVVFEDALTQVRADVVYTYTKAGLSQDVVFRDRLPDSAVFGLNASSTKLLLYSEFYNPPQAVVHRQAHGQVDDPEDQIDELDFGVTRLVRGKAFGVGGSGSKHDIPVNKQWRMIGGRRFLIEEIPLPQVQAELEALPKRQGAAVNSTNALWRTASLELKLPPALPQAKAKHTNEMLMANNLSSAPGFVVDWLALNGTTNDFTFAGDTTYFVTGPFIVSAKLTMEGGTVIKYTNTPGSYGSAYVLANGTLDCQGEAYKPIVCTDQNDNSVGEVVPGSTGSPLVGSYLGLATRDSLQMLRGMRFLYAWVALQSGNGLILEDSQLVKCDIGLDLYARPLTLRNVLFGQVSVPINGSTPLIDVVAEHVTADRIYYFAGMNTTLGATLERLSLTNCLFTQVTNFIWSPLNTPAVSSNALTWVADASGVYQAAGAGNYYLADNSPYRNVGTTNVSANVLGLLRTRTTYPPIMLTNPVSAYPFTLLASATLGADTTFTPQAQRDTGIPALGYHYAPLDYLVNNVQATNVTVRVSDGAVLGYGTDIGFWLLGNSSLVCEGSPTRMNGFVRSACVQEQPMHWSGAGFDCIPVVALNSNNFHLDASFRFTLFSTLAPGNYHLIQCEEFCFTSLNVRDCQFWNGPIYASSAWANQTSQVMYANNLLVRANP